MMIMEERDGGIDKQPKSGKRIVRWILRVFAALFLIIGGVIVAGGLFLMLNPVFGGRVSKEQQKSYAERAANYSDGKFAYPEAYIEEGLTEDVRVSTKERKPMADLPVVMRMVNQIILVMI